MSYNSYIKSGAAFILILYLGACSASKKTIQYNYQQAAISNSGVTVPGAHEDNNTNQVIQKKYAACLDVPVDSITNIRLYNFIDKWLNTPYKWGGTNKDGIDCSAFIQRLFYEVYGLKIPRSSIEQLFAECVERFRSPQYLCEGDILFFRTNENKVISHVGIYLLNNKFINSSSTTGVCIGSLNNIYWKARFVAGGRINASLAK